LAELVYARDYENVETLLRSFETMERSTIIAILKIDIPEKRLIMRIVKGKAYK
jgi:hypothetical protein